VILPSVVTGDSSGLLALIEELQNINPTDSLAQLNETTISDNNGGRIEL